MQTLTQDQLDEIVNATTRSGAQKAAVTKALTLAQDVMLTGQARDTTALTVPKIQTACAVFVVSGAKPLPKRTVGAVNHRAETQLCWSSLMAADERFGPITVVTFGNFGCEFNAARYAKANDRQHIEVAPVWNEPQADGSTVRNQSALKTRDAVIKAMVAQVQTPIALLFGEGSQDFNKARAVFATLTRAGAFHKANPAPTQPQDPGAEAAGHPDVPVAS